MTFVEGMGRIGKRINFGDFRDVSEMFLPFEVKVTATELGVELPEVFFSLTD